MIQRYIVKFEATLSHVQSTTWELFIEDLSINEKITLPKNLFIEMSTEDAIHYMNQYCRELNNIHEDRLAYINEITNYTK